MRNISAYFNFLNYAFAHSIIRVVYAVETNRFKLTRSLAVADKTRDACVSVVLFLSNSVVSTVSQKTHQLRNGIAQNCKDQF